MAMALTLSSSAYISFYTASASPRRRVCPSHARAQAGNHKELSFTPARRSTLLLPLFLISQPFPAAADDNVDYQEEKFSLTVPRDWVKGEGKASGVRKVVAFHPSSDTSANVNVIITNLGPDYTGMGSFGSVDAFAANVVASMDRSYVRPPGRAAKLVDAVSKNSMYYIEYTLQTPGEPQKHLLSAVGIGDTKFYKQLYTVTGQYWESDADKYRQILQQVCKQH